MNRKLNIQDTIYKQVPNLLNEGIRTELKTLKNIIHEQSISNTEYISPKIINPKISRISLKSIKRTQFGEYYKNASSEHTANQFKKFLDKKISVKDLRLQDLYPILLDRKTKEILDGNHRHYALSKINSPYVVVLYVNSNIFSWDDVQ